EIDMRAFRKMENSICYGCAATNAILHIMEANKEEVEDHIRDRNFDAAGARAMNKFEKAINYLSCGDADGYNQYAADCGIASITPMPGQELPYLRNDYTEDQLEEYVKLAEYQNQIQNWKESPEYQELGDLQKAFEVYYEHYLGFHYDFN